jgi:threonine dehydratase
VVAEPAGATAYAAISSGAYRPARGEHIGVVISGANTTAVELG